MAGFEPTTTCPPDKCATRLRYIPISFLYTTLNKNAIFIFGIFIFVVVPVRVSVFRGFLELVGFFFL